MSLLAMLPLAASVAAAAGGGGGLVEPRRQPLFVCIQQQQSLVASLCTLSPPCTLVTAAALQSEQTLPALEQ